MQTQLADVHARSLACFQTQRQLQLSVLTVVLHTISATKRSVDKPVVHGGCCWPQSTLPAGWTVKCVGQLLLHTVGTDGNALPGAARFASFARDSPVIQDPAVNLCHKLGITRPCTCGMMGVCANSCQAVPFKLKCTTQQQVAVILQHAPFAPSTVCYL